MQKLTMALVASLLLGISSYAMAQATSPNPSTNPQTGTAAPSRSGSTQMTANDVKHELEMQGYSDVRNIHQDKDGWKAIATKNGKQVAVDLDKNGKIETR